MRTLLLLIALATSLSACITVKPKYARTDYPMPFELERIDTVKGTKAELFVIANEWIANTYRSAKDVIQMHDKEAGKIIAKGYITTESVYNGMFSITFYVYYTTTIDVKDGRCKVKFSDFVLEQGISPASKYTSGIHNYNWSLSYAEPPNTVTKTQWNNIRGDAWNAAMQNRLDLKEKLKAGAKNW